MKLSERESKIMEKGELYLLTDPINRYIYCRNNLFPLPWIASFVGGDEELTTFVSVNSTHHTMHSKNVNCDKTTLWAILIEISSSLSCLS